MDGKKPYNDIANGTGVQKFEYFEIYFLLLEQKNCDPPMTIWEIDLLAKSSKKVSLALKRHVLVLRF